MNKNNTLSGFKIQKPKKKITENSPFHCYTPNHHPNRIFIRFLIGPPQIVWAPTSLNMSDSFCLVFTKTVYIAHSDLPLEYLLSHPKGKESSGHSLPGNEVLWSGSEVRTSHMAPSDHGLQQGPSFCEPRGEGVSHARDLGTRQPWLRQELSGRKNFPLHYRFSGWSKN